MPVNKIWSVIDISIRSVINVSTACWEDGPLGWAARTSRAEAPAGVLAGAGAYQQWDLYNIGLVFVVQFKTLLFEYRCDINQAFYVTATPYSIQNHTFTGEPLHKTYIFCHSDLYRTLQEQRPSTKSRKNCRTVLFYGAFELFWPASIIKMTQKMMDGFIRDTICWSRP